MNFLGRRLESWRWRAQGTRPWPKAGCARLSRPAIGRRVPKRSMQLSGAAPHGKQGSHGKRGPRRPARPSEPLQLGAAGVRPRDGAERSDPGAWLSLVGARAAPGAVAVAAYPRLVREAAGVVSVAQHSRHLRSRSGAGAALSENIPGQGHHANAAPARRARIAGLLDASRSRRA